MVRPPGPRPAPLAGVRALRREPLELLSRLASYGDIASFRIGPNAGYFLNHPEYAKQVLVTDNHDFMKGRALQEAKRIVGEGLLTSEGEFHRRQRRLIQPIFHHDRIASYADVMVSYSERASDRWRDGEMRDVYQDMVRLTMAIVAKTLFDTDLEAGDAREVGEALSVAIRMFERYARPFAGLVEHLPLPANRRFRRAREGLDAIVYGMIEHRRAAGATGDDLLSLLLQAQDEGFGMTDRQVRDETMTLFLAGHETTANALTWTWYLLSQNPEAEARLHEEVDHVAGQRLPYTETVFAEAMRLFPPAYGIGRRALRDVEIGGYVIPERSLVVMSQWVMHRDVRWFPEPERFLPECFTEAAKAERPRFAYFPFGGGPRVCIGEPFAWMEGVLVLATIARRWRMRPVPGHTVTPSPRITLRPRDGMPMIVERRHV